MLVASYLAYVGMSIVAPALVAHRVAGVFTVGLLFGCAQIAIVAVVAARYTAEMGRVDPLADAVRAAAQDRTSVGGAER